MTIDTVRTFADEINSLCVQSPPAPTAQSGYAYIPGNAPDPIHEIVKKLGVLAGELGSVDPANFPVSHQSAYVEVRKEIIDCVKAPSRTQPQICGMVERLIDLLPHHQNGDGHPLREFLFIASPDLRLLVERDFKELEYHLFPNKAWKSVVIMCGSILEAVLYDQLTKDQTAIDTAMASNVAPTRGRRANQRTRDISSTARDDSWTLEHLIDVSVDVAVIPNDAGAIHAALRKFRNLVHPLAELRLQIPIGQGPGEASHGMLITILDHLS